MRPCPATWLLLPNGGRPPLASPSWPRERTAVRVSHCRPYRMLAPPISSAASVILRFTGRRTVPHLYLAEAPLPQEHAALVLFGR